MIPAQYLWESPPAKMGLRTKSKMNLLIQPHSWAIQNERLCAGSGPGKKKLTKKKPNKKAKRRTACLAEKSKTTHPSAPSLYQLNTAARRRASAAQHRAAAHTLPTNHSWDVYGQSIKNPFWWLEGPLDSFQIMGLAPCLQQWEKAITTVSGQWH